MVRCRVNIDTKRERRHLFHYKPKPLRVPPFYVEEFRSKLQNKNAALEEEDGNINETTINNLNNIVKPLVVKGQRVRNSAKNCQEVLQRNPDGETKESSTTNVSSRAGWSSRTEQNHKKETTSRFQKAQNGNNSRSNQARKRLQNGKGKNPAAESFNLQEF